MKISSFTVINVWLFTKKEILIKRDLKNRNFAKRDQYFN